jgi:catechol 2,3-dioxygenase-like lactoylglutathione lyase family enzyme
MPKEESSKIKLRWGHININVSNLDSSIEFYEKLGFEVYKPSIPYIGLTVEPKSNSMDEGSRTALGLPEQTSGRACIMQLDKYYPKLDLTQFDDMTQSVHHRLQRMAGQKLQSVATLTAR